MESVVQQAGDVCCAIRVEIGATDIVDEQRIASEHAERTVTGLFMTQDDGNGIQRMSWRFEHCQSRFAEFEPLAFARCLGIGHVVFIRRPVQHDGAGSFAKALRTGNEALVAVGFEDVGDADAAFLCDAFKDRNVAAWIDDRSLKAVPNDVGKVG